MGTAFTKVVNVLCPVPRTYLDPEWTSDLSHINTLAGQGPIRFLFFFLHSLRTLGNSAGYMGWGVGGSLERRLEKQAVVNFHPVICVC